MTRSYISIPASANAREAQVMAADKAEIKNIKGIRNH